MLWFVVIKGVFVKWLLLLLLLVFLSLFNGFPGGTPSHHLLWVLIVIGVLGWLLIAKLQLFQHLHKQRLLSRIVLDACLSCQFFTRLHLFVLQCGFRCVHRECVLHPVEVKVLFDHVRDQAAFLALVHLLRGRILPLKPGGLLGSGIGIFLDGFEHAWP